MLGSPCWPLGKGRNAAGASLSALQTWWHQWAHTGTWHRVILLQGMFQGLVAEEGDVDAHTAQQQLLEQEPPLALTAQGTAGASWGTQAGDACTDLHHWRGKRDRDKVCLLLISPCVSSDSQIFLVL